MGILSSLFSRGSACPRCGQKSPLAGPKSRWDPIGPAAAPTGYRCRDCGTALQPDPAHGATAPHGHGADAAGHSAAPPHPRPSAHPPAPTPAPAKPQRTPDTSIHVASEVGDLARVTKFLQDGVSASEPDPVGLQPLHYAANRGHTDVMALLIEHGADVNAQGEQGLAPLHGAAYHGTLTGIQFLIDHGADVNIRTGKNFTPLAIARFRNQQAAMDLLQSLGGVE